MKIAIPSNSPGGLEADRSDHFGHCDVFTIVDLDAEKNSIKTVAEAVEKFAADQLPVMHADQVCKGSGNCHH